MKHYYEARRDSSGKYHGEVFHISNIDDDKVKDYISKPYSDELSALEDVEKWLDDEGIEAEYY